jgi:CRP-like cAMP-binding protein
MKDLMDIMFQTKRNHLLAALSGPALARLTPHLEHQMMAPGRVLSRAGAALEYVYFPTTAVLSIHCLLKSGAMSELAIVGAEGVLGIEQFLGGTTPNHAVVQAGGHAFRLRVDWLAEEAARAGALQQLLLRYTLALMTKFSQMAVCNGHHTTEQRLSRWLLELSDRTHSRDVLATQEALGNVLGVRREAVTEAASHLQARQLIEYRRGHLRIVDRSGLEARACECYQLLLGESAPAPHQHGLIPA